jgi:hypothetical protein
MTTKVEGQLYRNTTRMQCSARQYKTNIALAIQIKDLPTLQRVYI